MHIYSRMKLPRLGAVLLATIAREHGWDVRVYVEDIGKIDYRDVLTADLVGISTITSTAARAYVTRIEELAAVIRDAEPGGGHKCANSGAIRFRMEDGSVIGIGLLPGHTEGRYGFRLYDGDRYVAVYSVSRARLLAAIEGLGVPMDEPAFKE